MRRNGQAESRALLGLAREYGVQASFRDITHRRRQASRDTLLAVLKALGAPVEKPLDARDAVRERVLARWREPCDPVATAWDGGPAKIVFRLPRALSARHASLRLHLEDGSVRSLPVDLSRIPAAEETAVGSEGYVAKTVGLPGGLPAGYHRLEAGIGGIVAQVLVISAPGRAFAPPTDAPGRAWGVFLPLYALQSRKSLGSGDLSDLVSLMEWLSAMGGTAVGTLPLLAAFLSEPFHPSPYTPASRLFWNEFYLDVSRVPEFSGSGKAQGIFSSPAFREEADALRASPLVDYRRGMALKRSVLEEMARFFLAGNDPGRQGAFREFLTAKPDAGEYAAFRAAVERKRAPWPAWPAPERDGTIAPDAYDEEAKRYHLYVQWVAEEQLGAVSSRFREKGLSLYLDMPLGVSQDSYDVWRRRDLFALDASAGAPPDDFFTRGQDWGFPPMHPDRIRRDGYRYFRACLRHQFRHAGILRIDHVMGLHRFFWVPKGMTALEGAYVRYPAEELYAILCLESHRHAVRIVGEDLGTVPPYVRPAMKRHGFSRMFVVQFGLSDNPSRALGPVPPGALGCLNTHDMPPFASFWDGLDIPDRAALGLLAGEGTREEGERRARVKDALAAFLRRRGWLGETDPGAEDILAACLSFLAASPAGVVIAGLEDLFLETNPQNVPGTWIERPNWLRKARHGIESFREMPRVVRILREVDRIRKGGEGRTSSRERGAESTRKEAG